MSNLQSIIDELRAIRREVKKVNAIPCRCSSYPFPHRFGGGKCGDHMPERNVPYHHSRQAMLDAGFHEKDFG